MRGLSIMLNKVTMPKNLKHQNNQKDAGKFHYLASNPCKIFFTASNFILLLEKLLIFVGLKALLQIVEEPKAEWILWRKKLLIPIFSRQDIDVSISAFCNIDRNILNFIVI